MSRASRRPSGAPGPAEEDLEKILTRDGSLPIADALAILLAAADALGEAHARGVVHGQLAPNRLLVHRDANGTLQARVRGLARKADSGKSALFRPPAYLAPEQLRSDASVDARADVWSMGVILHEALTGALPFRASSIPDLCAAIVASAASRVRERRPEVPPGVDEVVERCLRKDPAARFASASDFAGALRAAPFAPGSDATRTALGGFDAPIAGQIHDTRVDPGATQILPTGDAGTLVGNFTPRVVPEVATLVGPARQSPRGTSSGSMPPRRSASHALDPATPLPQRGPDPTSRIAAVVVALAAVAIATGWFISRESPRAREAPPATTAAPAIPPPADVRVPAPPVGGEEGNEEEERDDAPTASTARVRRKAPREGGRAPHERVPPTSPPPPPEPAVQTAPPPSPAPRPPVDPYGGRK